MKAVTGWWRVPSISWASTELQGEDTARDKGKWTRMQGKYKDNKEIIKIIIIIISSCF
jgi:hypothetical protein